MRNAIIKRGKVDNIIVGQRREQYGITIEQIEYAVENGFQALIGRNIIIKESLPERS